ncbi:MAG: endoglucanase [Clostridia bacterium]|nr:endoglucanase [Clostridia bacterium]
MLPIRSIPYAYKHLPIGGGGYVTGFIFHPTADVLYCRTDIGGVYRFDSGSQVWIPLAEAVSPMDMHQAYPISVALDPRCPARLYAACGVYRPDGHGALAVSEDYGETFTQHPLPFFVHGNLHGRGAGERLIVDPADPDTLWMASQLDGLWVSRDRGLTWEKSEAFPETACTMVARQGELLLVGTEGLAHRTENMRGHSLYASFDGGASFMPVPQPNYVHPEGSKLGGLVAQRCSFDGQYLYVSFSANGPRSQNVERGYTCDNGDCSAGRLARYPFDGRALGELCDITPEKGAWGYSAIDAKHDLLVTATIGRRDGDAIYLSRDQGETWTTVLHRLEKGRMDFRLSYMQPRFNGGRNLIHWMTDVKLDPRRPGTAWFNTGTGVFRTHDVTAETPVWQDWCDGMEETVHIGVTAPPAGRVLALDMIGDLGGFAFTDVDKHCENSFADRDGHRWITCLSCDFPDADPDHIVVTARGNWTGKTQGGLIVSRDGAKSWTRLPTPLGLSTELDALLQRIERPNINAGWVAVSADGNTYVWAPADRIFLHAKHLIVSHDQGSTFRRSVVLDRDGKPAEGMLKPVADRWLPNVFYGFGDKGELYLSVDGGDTFCQQATPAGFPAVHFAKVDCADRTEIRAAAGQPGTLYVATGEGLWKLQCSMETGAFSAKRLTAPGDRAFCVGLGLARPDGDYLNDMRAGMPPAIYLSGVIGTEEESGGAYGFYRTLDEGRTFVRLNTDRQLYGGIQSIDGDKRVFGRFFIATGTLGLMYGEENNHAH